MRHQLHDDRRGNVRHNTQCEQRHPRERTTAKHVEHAKNPATLLLKKVGHDPWIDPRDGYVRSRSKDNEREQHE